MARTIFDMNKYELGLTKSILSNLVSCDDEKLAEIIFTDNNIQLLLKEYYELVRDVYEERFHTGCAYPQ